MCCKLKIEQLEVTSYLSAFKELERSANVRDPVDSFKLAALFARLQSGGKGSRRNIMLAESYKRALTYTWSV